jgi:signal transduction histidine kinase
MKVFVVLRLWWLVWCLGMGTAAAWANDASPLLNGLKVPATISPAMQKDLALLPAVPLRLDRGNTLTEAVVTPGSDSPPGLDSSWMRIQLPHRWATTHGAYEGSMWYRFRVRLADAPVQPWAVYMPRVNMNGQVWVNGVPMAFNGSLTAPVTRNWYVPQLVQVPPGTWRAGDNEIVIHVVSGYLSRNGLSAVDVGPHADLVQSYKWRELAQVDAPLVANVSLMALGLFMVMVWLRDRSQDAIALQGLAAIFWGVGNMASWAPEPFLPLFWWESLAYIFVVTSQLLICLFFWRFVGRRVRAIDFSIYALLVATPVLTVFWPTGTQIVLTFVAIFVLMAISSSQALLHVIRTRRPDGWVLVFGCVLAMPVAAHDLAFELNFVSYDSIFWLAYAGPLLMYCTFYILAGDHARSRHDLAHLNATLASQVAEREAALRDSFQRLAELERAQAVQAERSRILRDMHDGVGAHLSSALRQLQVGRQQPVDLNLVIQTLRDSLDQLKLSVDALTLAPGDVVGLLASLRFRIAPRLKAAGLELIWNVQDLPNWPAGQPPALRQLQYILFEGLSNVLQHSGAMRLTLSARARAGEIEVMLSDDGCGWNGEGEGAGIQTMRARAKVVGAQLHLTGTPGRGTELRIVLPLTQHDQLDLSSAA